MTFTVDDEFGNSIELKPDGSTISVTEYKILFYLHGHKKEGENTTFFLFQSTFK